MDQFAEWGCCYGLLFNVFAEENFDMFPGDCFAKDSCTDAVFPPCEESAYPRSTDSCPKYPPTAKEDEVSALHSEIV